MVIHAFRLAVSGGNLFKENPAGLFIVVLVLRDEIELVISADGAGGLDTGGLQLLADVPAAAVGADIERATG